MTKSAPIENVPFRITTGSVTVNGFIVRLFRNDITVSIDDGTGRTKGLHAPYFQMGHRHRNPQRYHYAVADDSGALTITEHGWHIANRLLAALYREGRTVRTTQGDSKRPEGIE
jgi:hypothetical protein